MEAEKLNGIKDVAFYEFVSLNNFRSGSPPGGILEQWKTEGVQEFVNLDGVGPYSENVTVKYENRIFELNTCFS